MKRLRIPFDSVPAGLAILVLLIPVLAGCGGSDPDPATVLDRALTRENLSGFANGPAGPTGGVVSVQALGYEDRVLEQREVEASPRVMSDLRQALGADSGLRRMVDELEYEGSTELSGAETEHVSGELDVDDLAHALRVAGGEEVGALAGLGAGAKVEDSLAAADFDLYAGKDDGVIRRLDLTLAFDDPDNALPATRIRFSLTPDSPGATLD